MFLLIILILAILVWFCIPYSPIKSEFKKLIRNNPNKLEENHVNFTKEDISKLPNPLQKYFHYCGYISTPKMSNARVHFSDVNFVQGSKKLKIQYTLYSFVSELKRFALIDTSIMGIPFEGLDSYEDGIGRMKGQIGKLITLFDEKGTSMNKACLVTYLSESLVIPNILLQDFVNFEELDATHVKVNITYYEISTSGIFEFDSNGAIVRFTTKDREYNDGNKTIQNVSWSALFEEYRDINGIKLPTVMKAVWHLDEGDLLYFDGKNMEISYDALS
ncbi:hypothetical protein NNC19_13705 [Clostridium sp. SHJSY1]|uniref:DUF6544 family protein n=1 Tax=Clostridium sp. SHJSY1 TaxID=2942483 RepID=UPI002876BD9E|nr:DUF6544 family protein [Clostridium sp. SHJSY1]MDS0526742.1 hypothetical protein [Clostridium sp. SHJSY1]